jgi:hypothetical protein
MYYSVFRIHSVKILSNVSFGSSRHTKAVVDAGALAPLTALLGSSDLDLVSKIVWILSRFIFSFPNLKNYFIEEGVIVTLLEFVGEDSYVSRD